MRSRFLSLTAWKDQIHALAPPRRKKNTKKQTRSATVTPLAMEATMPPAAAPAVELAVSIPAWIMARTKSGTAASVRADWMAVMPDRKSIASSARYGRSVTARSRITPAAITITPEATTIDATHTAEAAAVGDQPRAR